MEEPIKFIIKSYLTEAYKWTEDALRDEAMKYKNKKEFYQNSASAYSKALSKGQDFFNEITKHFSETPKTPYKWDEESIAKEALKYDSKTKFRSGSPGAYDAAKKIGKEFYDKITSHMPEVSPRKWSEQSLEDEAKKYFSRKEFFDNSHGAYSAAKRVGDDFFNKITSHMKDQRGPSQVVWTDEILVNLAKNFDKLSDFTKEQPAAYQALFRKPKEFRDFVTQHMEKRRLPYTDEELRQIAAKYSSSGEFQRGDGSAMEAAKKRGENFFREITKHFQRLSRIPYTYDEVKNEAAKYQTIGEFQKNKPGAYNAAKRHGWSDDVTAHMIPLRRNWTKEEISEISKNYNTIKDFRKDNSAAYSWSLVNMTEEERKEAFKHMKKIGNYANRLIYAFEFPDKSVYVGLTYNPDIRLEQHKKDVKSAVLNYQNKTGLKPTFKHITDYMSMEEAATKEGDILEEYIKNGWNILNRKKTGALGSIILKWTYENVRDEALKYKSRVEFEKNNGSAYFAAKKRGWFDDVTKHMSLLKRDKYSQDELNNIAKKYQKLKDFRKHNAGAYQAAKKIGNDFFNTITSHMSSGPQKGSIWDDFEKVKNEALKYNNGQEFRKYSSGAYKSAFRNNWYGDISKHFIYKKKWTYDNLKKEAQKYKTRKDFLRGNNSAYQTAYKNGYLNDFFPSK